jgi:integrase
MRTNPTLRFKIPTETNPRRPVETEARFQKVRARAPEITMEVTWSGKAVKGVPTFLETILDIANGTGRRVNAILSLRMENLLLDQGPCGMIRWPAKTDKKGVEWIVPVSPDVRAAIDAQLERRAACEYMSTSPWLFPAPRSLKKHVRMETATAWLHEAQELAGVPKLERGNWHPLRRKWASERKHLSHVDAAAAGGWKDTKTFTDCYASADMPTMYEVVTNAKPRREDFSEDD